MGSRRHLLLLAGLLFAQLALFHQYVVREVAWAYPGSFDQAVYLHKTYDLFHRALEQGPGTAFRESLAAGGATGVMLPMQGAVMQLFLGSNRFAVLLLNFGYFALLQGILFYTGRWLTGRAAGGWLAVGLLLMEKTPFFPAGGLFDFRMDSIAGALYAVFLCLMVRATALRDARWLAGAAACALLLFLFRFLTFVYVVGFFMTLWTGLLGLGLLPWTRGTQGTAAWAGLRRSGLAAAGFLVATVPIVVLNWQAIHDYYVVSDITGEEKNIRAVEFGISGLAGHLLFHLRSLATNHLGTTFLIVSAILTVAAILGFLLRRGAPDNVGRTVDLISASPAEIYPITMLVAITGVFVPWFVLTINHHKTPVVINIIAPAIVLLLLVLVSWFRPRSSSTLGKWGGFGVAAVAMGLGLSHWFGHLSTHGDYSLRRASVQQVNALYDHLAEQAVAFDYHSPVLSTDEVRDWIWFETINVGIYERTGQRLAARGSLGARIFAPSREEVFNQLAVSDMVLLTSFPKSGPYPFYDVMRVLGPEVRAWCDAHLLRSREFPIEGATVTTYLHPDVPVEGLSGGWILPEGVSLPLNSKLCQQLRASGKHTLVLEGELHRAWLGGVPQITATVGGADGPRLPARFEEKPGDHYRMEIEVGELLAAPGSPAGLRVFLRLGNASFVPKEIGLNEDTRRLVVMEPTRKTFE